MYSLQQNSKFRNKLLQKLKKFENEIDIFK